MILSMNAQFFCQPEWQAEAELAREDKKGTLWNMTVTVVHEFVYTFVTVLIAGG